MKHPRLPETYLALAIPTGAVLANVILGIIVAVLALAYVLWRWW